MVVTVTLANGARRLAQRRVIVKRLAAIHDLGAMDVLCTDKTGTLAEYPFASPATSTQVAMTMSGYSGWLTSMAFLKAASRARWMKRSWRINMSTSRPGAKSMRYPSTSSAAACEFWWMMVQTACWW